MPMFSYRARDVQGNAIDSQIEASSTDTAATRLIENGLTPIDIQIYSETGSVVDQVNIMLLPKVENTDLIQFCRQMHSMLRAGIPIFRAITGLADTTSNVKLKSTLREVMGTLESGRTLSDALAQHPKVFSSFFVSLVQVGETTGKIEIIFKQLAFYLDRDHTTKAKIKAAIRYPSFVLIAISLALAVVTIWVIPAFNSMFESFGESLPLPTRILMNVSSFMVNYWIFVLLGIVMVFFGVGKYINTDSGRYRWDKLKLNLPLVGSVIYKASLARFSHLFSMSINSGIPMASALSVVGNALNNSFLEERLLSMREGIEQGRSLSLAANNSGMFDPLVLQMLAVGDETGTTGELLEEVADYYDREVDYATARLSSAIEPILTVVIGGLLLVMAMGIFLPMWDLASVALH